MPLRPWGGIISQERERKGDCRGRISFLPHLPWAKSILAAPSAQPYCWARARGWLPPSRALLAPSWAPSLSSLQSSPPCPLPPRAGSLIFSSWKPDSLFPLLSPLPPSLSPKRRLPLPWGGSGHKGACLLLSPGSSPPPQPPSTPRRPPAAVPILQLERGGVQRAWVPDLALPSVCDPGQVAPLSRLGFLLMQEGGGSN